MDGYTGLMLLQVASHSPCLFPILDLASVISREPWFLLLENSKMVIDTKIWAPDGLVSTEVLFLLAPKLTEQGKK